MSCVCILTPVVIAAWPAFSAAVTAAAASMGYQVLAHCQKASAQISSAEVQLEIPRSELVTDQLRRDQQIVVTRDGITVTFARDERGRASVCVNGSGQTKEELLAAGEQLSQRVVQRYVYQRLMEEVQARQFTVVEEEVDANHAIRLKVRHWSS
jgi:hypothetical protein